MDKHQRARLIGQAHQLNPSVTIAGKGLHETVQAEIEEALRVKELIKLKFSGYDKADKTALIDSICQQTGAELIQLIGHVAILFRPKPVQ